MCTLLVSAHHQQKLKVMNLHEWGSPKTPFHVKGLYSGPMPLWGPGVALI